MRVVSVNIDVAMMIPASCINSFSLLYNVIAYVVEFHKFLERKNYFILPAAEDVFDL